MRHPRIILKNMDIKESHVVFLCKLSLKKSSLVSLTRRQMISRALLLHTLDISNNSSRGIGNSSSDFSRKMQEKPD